MEVAPKRRSWREKVSNPMDITMPVGRSGVVKRVGDFTKDDVLLVAAAYTEKAFEAASAAEAWTGFAAKMEAGETIESASARLGTTSLPSKGKGVRQSAVDAILDLGEYTVRNMVEGACRYAALAPEHPKASPIGYLNSAVATQAETDADDPSWVVDDVAEWLEEQKEPLPTSTTPTVGA